jgi:hypothetical protein
MSFSRRHFIGLAPLAGLALGACRTHAYSVLPAQLPITWSNFEIQYASSQELTPHSSTPSPGGKLTSLLFDNLHLDVQSNTKALSGTSALLGQFSVQLPPKTGLDGYIASMRGFVAKSANARGVALLDIAGTSRLLEWPFGDEMNKDVVETFACVDQRPADSIHSAISLVISVSLVAERRSLDDFVQIAIDSFDFEVLTV